MRMRAGAYKLLVASTKREQVLDASRSLLTCNSRIKAYTSEARRRKEQQDIRRLEQQEFCQLFFLLRVFSGNKVV